MNTCAPSKLLPNFHLLFFFLLSFRFSGAIGFLRLSSPIPYSLLPIPYSPFPYARL